MSNDGIDYTNYAEKYPVSGKLDVSSGSISARSQLLSGNTSGPTPPPKLSNAFQNASTNRAIPGSIADSKNENIVKIEKGFVKGTLGDPDYENIAPTDGVVRGSIEDTMQSNGVVPQQFTGMDI